jgi:hypothetical protein
MSPTSSVFIVGYFLAGVLLTIWLDYPPTMVILYSVSWLARMIGLPNPLPSFLIFETRPCYKTLGIIKHTMSFRSLKLVILLPQLPECGNDRPIALYILWSMSWLFFNHLHSLLHSFRQILVYLSQSPYIAHDLFLRFIRGILIQFHGMPVNVPMKTWNPYFFCSKILIIVEISVVAHWGTEMCFLRFPGKKLSNQYDDLKGYWNLYSKAKCGTHLWASLAFKK